MKPPYKYVERNLRNLTRNLRNLTDKRTKEHFHRRGLTKELKSKRKSNDRVGDNQTRKNKLSGKGAYN
jgi:hypothetical protein